MKYSAIWLFSLSLLVLPLLVWFSFTQPVAWTNRLYLPEIIPPVEPNTPVYYQGTIIPSRLSSPLTFTAADNPILLTGPAVVEPSGQLTFAAGSSIYTSPFSSLTIQGKLTLNGTSNQPVTFTTNEQFAADQTWAGIIIQDSGQADIQFAHLRFASPAISCLPTSHVKVIHSLIEIGSLGTYINHSDCAISDTTIRGVRDGIIIKSATPKLINNDISATHQNIQTFEN